MSLTQGGERKNKKSNFKINSEGFFDNPDRELRTQYAFRQEQQAEN